MEMEKVGNLRIFWRILIRVVIVIQLCSKCKFVAEANEIGTSAAEFRNYDGFDIKERLGKIEAKSRQQESKIEFLNTARKEDKELINHLLLRVEHLEASTSNSKTNTAGRINILGRQKRPVRLLPPHILK